MFFTDLDGTEDLNIHTQVFFDNVQRAEQSNFFQYVLLGMSGTEIQATGECVWAFATGHSNLSLLQAC